MYTTEELVAAARKTFKQSGALVAAALKASGKKTFKLGEAKKIIKAFANKKVK